MLDGPKNSIHNAFITKNHKFEINKQKEDRSGFESHMNENILAEENDFIDVRSRKFNTKTALRHFDELRCVELRKHTTQL